MHELEQIKYELVDVNLPQLNELSFEKIVDALVTINNDFRNEELPYLAVLKHHDVQNADTVPWLLQTQVFLTQHLSQIDWSNNIHRRMLCFIFIGILQRENDILIPNFPLKLFISNDLELLLQAHRSEFISHFRPRFEQDVFDNFLRSMEFEYGIFRGVHLHTISNYDYGKYPNTRH